MKYHIDNNTVQETLIIPLFGRLVCSERFPELFSDPEARRICDSLDYNFAEKRKKMESPAGLFGVLEVIRVRNDLLPKGEREQNLAFDLNDFGWMDQIDNSNGAVFDALL